MACSGYASDIASELWPHGLAGFLAKPYDLREVVLQILKAAGRESA